MTQTPPPRSLIPSLPARWSVQAIIGFALLIAAAIVRRVYAVPDMALDPLALELAKAHAHTGGDIADILMGFGAALMAWAPALPTIKPPPTGSGSGPGNTATSLVVGCILGALALMAPGCIAREVRAEESVQWQRRPGATCYARLAVDGETAIEVEAPFSCVPPPEFCAPSEGEP